ncbi:MAG: Polysaccharide deacetylase [Methanomassiliicoccales archaeon PtaU1.Bin124]|nr:MAG: Polysaccharide deacetylase [Methanomassiliicoccales archaeon PtaU1.Bin124]
MRFAAFTVDVDRDVNQPCAGKACAMSKEGEGQGAPRFTSSAEGLKEIVDVLNDLDVRATFFFEGRTALEISKRVDLPSLMRGHEVACHGFDHEDMTGEKTGVRPKDEDLDDILARSGSTVRELFGIDRPGFRAPYQATDQRLQDALLAKDFRYESSMTEPLLDGKVRPFMHSNGLVQVPIASGTDRKGRKIVAYLWPMHEGKRVPQDYLDLLSQFEDGLFVMATHTWHMVENFCEGMMAEEERLRQSDGVREIIERAMDEGIEFIRIDDYLEEHHGGSC